MQRIIFIDYQGRFVNSDRELMRQLVHRRAAAERCLRSGWLRRCTPVPPSPQAG